MVTRKIRVAIAGQPNVGKSTLFNVLTGGSVHVANWPGTTVEKHYGKVRYKVYEIELTDLPGTYGLGCQTIEEKIARDFIVSGEYNVILILVDAVYPERTLNLVVETLELTKKAVVVLTKIDEAHKHGVHVNVEGLSRELGVPVIPVSCKTRQGLYELLDTIVKSYEKGFADDRLTIDYGELEPYIKSIERKLSELKVNFKYPVRWITVRFLEGDGEAEEYLSSILEQRLYDEIVNIRETARRAIGDELFEVTAFYRRHHVSKLANKYVVRSKGLEVKETALNKMLFNPVLGGLLSLVFYIAVFLTVFQINTGFPLNMVLNTFGLHSYAEFFEKISLSNIVDETLSHVSDLIYGRLGENVYAEFIVEGVVRGVGAILLFIPLILAVSLALAIIEDSGLAPRLAVASHSLLSKIGLSGHAVFPITVSYGCNVPGILVTRASLDPLERLRLILTLSFIPCQARLIVILAVASTLTYTNGVLLIALSYLSSLAVFIVINKLLLMCTKGGERSSTPELLLEIPPLHRPLLKVVWWNSWSLTKHFITKAGLVIFTTSVIVWFLINTSITQGFVEDPSQSSVAQISRHLTVFFKPIGVSGNSSWLVPFGVLTGFVAKEIYVSSILISTGQASLDEAFKFIGLNDIQVIALTLYVVLYVPCIATLATIYLETKSVKYTVLATTISLLTAYIVMIIVYHILWFTLTIT